VPAFLAGVFGVGCECWELLDRGGCARLEVESGPGGVEARVVFDVGSCGARVLGAWPRIVGASAGVEARGGWLVAVARGRAAGGLVAEARRSLLGVEPAPVAVGSVREAGLVMAVAAGIVAASLERGGPVRRRAGLALARRLLGQRLAESTYYKIARRLVDAGVFRGSWRRPVEPVEGVDLYYGALWLASPGAARERVYSLLRV